MLLLFQSGKFNEDMIPTVGFNMRKVTKGNVVIKVVAVFAICFKINLYQTALFDFLGLWPLQ